MKTRLHMLTLLIAFSFLPAASSVFGIPPEGPPPPATPEQSFDDHEEEEHEDDEEDHDEDHHDDDEEHEEYEPTLKETWAFIESEFPAVSKRVQILKKEDDEHAKEEIEELMEHFSHILVELHYMKEEEPQLAEKFLATEKMEVQLHVLADAFHDTEDDKKRAAIKKKFRATSGRLFDARIAMERQHLKRMQEEIKAIRAEIEEMVENREAEINEQVAWLEGDEDEEEDWEEEEDEDLDEEDDE